MTSPFLPLDAAESSRRHFRPFIPAGQEEVPLHQKFALCNAGKSVPLLRLMFLLHSW
jgi:hypothetical protein